MAHIVVVGNFNVDLVMNVHHFPAPGETIIGHDFTTGPGGKGSNQAVAASKLGADVHFIGRVGDDAFSEIGYNLWRDVGVNTDFVVRDPAHSTGIATIIVERYKENIIVVTPGANLALSTEDIDRAEEVIAAADILMTQLEINIDVAAYALKVARKHKVRTLLNPAPLPPPAFRLSKEMLSNVDIVTPNAVELEILRDSATLPMNKKQALVVTHGRRGIHWISGDTDSMVPSFGVDIVNTVGGGDAFNAGLAVGLAEGKGMEQSLRFGNAAAAICITRHGAALSMPTRAEVETFLNVNV